MSISVRCDGRSSTADAFQTMAAKVSFRTTSTIIPTAAKASEVLVWVMPVLLA